MRNSWLPGILLGFPLVELLSLGLAAKVMGWWLLGYLALTTVAGVVLVRRGLRRLPGRSMGSADEFLTSGWSLLVASREMGAGFLFLIPGLVSDVAAVLLLLLGRGPKRQQPDIPSGPQTLEGEFRKED